MKSRSRLTTMAVALLALGVFARPVLGQITTGTVSGTVKDPQGAVIPGATVTLVNEGQGTRSAPVVTNATGDFVVVNVAPGTYTLEVELASFKTLKRSGLAVSPGSRVAVSDLTLDVGGTTETVMSKARPRSSSRAWRALVHRLRRAGREPAARQPQLCRRWRRSPPASTAPAGVGGGGATNFMMDGVGTMDTGSNRLLVP